MTDLRDFIRCVPSFLTSDSIPADVAILVDTSEPLKGIRGEDGRVYWETLEEYARRLCDEGKALQIRLTVENAP